ncbi:MAG: dehydrogenase [Chloroflexi bacterium]|nr:MAG: dehydrogenase [Chloroflexota bacterium]
MRVALIGAGRIGSLHARLLSATDGVERLTIADALPERAASVARDVGATAAPSIDAALDDAEAVVIAAATDAHADLIRAAIRRRLPTFCEKPLALDLGDTITLCGEIERSGVPFQLGFQRRFDAGYREARRLVETGELGTLYIVRMAGHDPAPPHESYIPVSGGLFRDFSIHDFDVLRWLTGNEVDEVYADGGVRGFEVFAKYGDVDTAVATFRLANGAFAVLTVARHDPLGYDIRTELFGSKDSVSVGLGPRMPLRSVEPGVPGPAGPVWQSFLVRFEDAYRAEFGAFLRVARGELASPCTARDGVEALRVSEAATTAVKEHRIVRMSEVAQ